MSDQSLTIRSATGGDDRALRELSVLDGRVVAALEVVSGTSVADPFVRSGEVVSLLDLRARQLREAA